MEMIKWITENYVQLLMIVSGIIAVAEMVTRLTPTKKDDGFVERVGNIFRKIMDFLKIPNVKKK